MNSIAIFIVYVIIQNANVLIRQSSRGFCAGLLKYESCYTKSVQPVLQYIYIDHSASFDVL